MQQTERQIGMDLIRRLFPDGEAGDYLMLALDDLTYVENILSGYGDEFDEQPINGRWPTRLLIIQPARPGETMDYLIQVTMEDVRFLRRCVASTIKSIYESQKGNT